MGYGDARKRRKRMEVRIIRSGWSWGLGGGVPAGRGPSYGMWDVEMTKWREGWRGSCGLGWGTGASAAIRVAARARRVPAPRRVSAIGCGDAGTGRERMVERVFGSRVRTGTQPR